MSAREAPSPLRLPDAPAIVAGAAEAAWVSADGEVETIPLAEAARRVRTGPPPLVCHMRATARRLGIGGFAACDLLELFAFVRPARFCLPTPRGLAAALGLAPPRDLEGAAGTLFAAAEALLGELAGERAQRHVPSMAFAMARGGWPWGLPVLSALAAGGEAPHGANLVEALRVWTRLKEWSDFAPEPPSGHLPVLAEEAKAELARLIGETAERRPQQAEYAGAVAAAFQPREREKEPHVVLAEAGTGVGKTLGYLAPAALWAERNHGPVWISTFTRNLQRQLDAELDRVYPNHGEKAHRVVVRKGRENYLCLLNLQEAVERLPARPGDAAALGLMARWVLASRDGDMVGGDFPGWLADLLGRTLSLELTDTRGECIHSACPHYSRCFVEKTVRRARRARIVVANHALVMVQAALGGADEAYLPTRYVFDEGHHLFDAADSAFSARLSGFETAELRRWLLGAEEGVRTRARGLKARLEGLPLTEEGTDALEELLRAARALPGPAWHQRLAGEAPVGATEGFLSRVRQQVYARAREAGSPYTLETEARPPVAGLVEAAEMLEAALARIARPITALSGALLDLLDDEADILESAARQRIEAMTRTLARRGSLPLAAWRGMLKGLAEETAAEGAVDWLEVERRDGRDRDVAMRLHWIDPMRAFAAHVMEPAHGVVVTSATLTDSTGTPEDDWAAAERRSGGVHVAAPSLHAQVPSPFDYAARTRVFVVNDLGRSGMDALAAAYRELFVAAGGGALGLFTAISRLRAVHQRIAAPLEAAGLPLLAQHVDGLDTGTLIDIFRSEDDACLLGTDAVRDGVDVPGRALRLIVFDRVPWPRPTILHRARKAAFEGGPAAYDDMITRLRLKQAYGRLIRRSDDVGVFVLLDRAFPSRLAKAFPEGVEVQRCGLAETIRKTGGFLAANEPQG